ncbi:MAG: UDP-N-acetylmuramoyl-L-alanine--D-glutamate ligase [Deltaproteobacteria bacterium]|nr:UDP-N-acetylmuramoyl-L-alanine--D-glutamate ligase [Deltaproteobacteria bacterium]
MNLKDKKVLIVGLGKTGFATARFLVKMGARVTVTDRREGAVIEGIDSLEEMGVTVECGGHHMETFLGSDLIVVSPGVPYELRHLREARDGGVETMSEIELASSFIDIPIVAVTGTNGKTTTTTLLGEIFAAAGRDVFVGGNIGTPLVEYLLSGRRGSAIILEVSSFQLEGIKRFRPRVAILLNVTEDHLDRYASIDEYCEAKFRIFENQKESDLAIVNGDDPMIMSRIGAVKKPPTVVPFSLTRSSRSGIFFREGEIIYAGEEGEERYPTGKFKLKGRHNLENIMAAIGAARHLGISRETILKTVERFDGLPHRMEAVRRIGGVWYYNDSKGTNVGALLKSLEGVEGPVILIAGGKDKGGNYSLLKDAAAEKVKLLILLGEAKTKIRGAIGTVAETVLAGSLEEAVRIASARCTPGDTVLLSPACSSFDMFKSFEDRGEQFKRLVHQL